MDSPDVTSAEFARRARSVGIVGNAWPYGPNADRAARFALVTWAEQRAVQYAPAGTCLHWLTQGRCPASGGCVLNRITYAWMDHITGWTRDGAPALLVCQPYDLDAEDQAGLAVAEAVHDLHVHIEAHGWYGHGTTMIELAHSPGPA